jgi:hypothetical protein
MPLAYLAVLSGLTQAITSAERQQQQAAARQANTDTEYMVAQGRKALGRPIPQLTCPNCGAPKAEHICAYCKT